MERYHVAVMELISELYHFMVNNELDIQKLSGGTGQLYTLLSNMEARILEKWLLNICLVLHEDMATPEIIRRSLLSTRQRNMYITITQMKRLT